MQQLFHQEKKGLSFEALKMYSKTSSTQSSINTKFFKTPNQSPMCPVYLYLHISKISARFRKNTFTQRYIGTLYEMASFYEQRIALPRDWQ